MHEPRPHLLYGAWLVSCKIIAMASDDEVVAATFKILVLGDSNVGKSSLIQSYCRKKKHGSMIPTIGEF